MYCLPVDLSNHQLLNSISYFVLIIWHLLILYVIFPLIMNLWDCRTLFLITMYLTCSRWIIMLLLSCILEYIALFYIITVVYFAFLCVLRKPSLLFSLRWKFCIVIESIVSGTRLLAFELSNEPWANYLTSTQLTFVI